MATKIDPAKIAAALAAAKAFKGGSSPTSNKPSAPVRQQPQATQATLLPEPPEELTAAPVLPPLPPDEPTDLDLTNPIHAGFMERLQALEVALLARDPMMKTHLAAIHKTMMQYDEVVVLLKPSEIAKIMAAQQAHTNTVLIQSTTGKSASSSARAAKRATGLTMSDV